MKVRIEYAASEKFDISNTYKCTFTNRFGSSWEVKHKYANFKSLHEFILVSAPLFVSAEFPKNFKSFTSSLLSGADHAESRRCGLEIWLNEVLANYELFPEKSIQAELDAFVKVPLGVAILETGEKRDVKPILDSNKFAAPITVSVPTLPSGRNKEPTNLTISSNKTYDFWELTKKSFEAYACSKSFSEATCISRTERVISSPPTSLIRDFLLELYKRRWCLTSIFMSFYVWQWLFHNANVGCILALGTLLLQLVIVEDFEIQKSKLSMIPSYLSVKIHLKQLFGTKRFNYNDISDVIPEDDLMLEIRRASARSEKRGSIGNSAEADSGNGPQRSASKLSSSEYFNHFEFFDLSASARAMFADRGKKHNFKVGYLAETDSFVTKMFLSSWISPMFD